MQKKVITRDDILSLDDYKKIRKENKASLIDIKKPRRVHVGPHATFYFENYQTMWSQIHEMLFIEQGGEEQIQDELEAYNPLIPNGKELVATFMIEIDDPVIRERTLYQLGHIEEHIYLSVDGEKSTAVPEQEVERTTEDGKTSSIHFLHFPLNENQIAKFQSRDCEVILGIEHAAYSHMAKITEETRIALNLDLDS